MASQNINVGTAANQGDGESLRSAFIDIRKMFAEVYGQTYTSDTQDLGGATLAIKENQLSVTNSPTDGYVLTYDNASGGFTWEQKFDGDITGIVAGDGLTGDATSGDATLAVGAGDGITVNADDIALASSTAGDGLAFASGVLSVNVDDSTIGITTDTLEVKDNGIDHDQLAVRFTDAKTDYGSITTTTTIDWSVAAIHELSMGGAATLNFSNYKKGQVIDLIINGDYTITLGTVSGTPSINQVGTSTYDGTTDNIIQVLCTDDDATPTFLYAVGAYTLDTNPA